MLKQFDLTDRVALVTGASSGIGAAAAELLAEAGAHVAIGYHHNRAGAEEVRDRIRAAGGTATMVAADVRHAAETRALVDTTLRELGPIDILVNNAGSLVQRIPLGDIPEALWDEIQTLNVKSALIATQAVIPAMRERRRGIIVNVGSIAGHHGGGPGAGAYSIAKAALMTMTKSLAKELAPAGIRVNGIAPGIIDTPFHEVFSTPEALKSWVAGIPLGRIGTPLECATAILFLASDAASYITGEMIEINGGQLMV
jgi:3-oxoacyl-[acyl-carrier protein] reductase